MGWDDVRDLVAGTAPALGTLLGGPAGAAVGTVIASALGTEPTPAAVSQAIQTDPAAAAKLRQIEADEAVALRRLTLEAETARIAERQATMRAEIASHDPYVRRWRPTWGYVTAATWAVQALGVFVLLGGAVFATIRGDGQDAAALITHAGELIGALTMQWVVALSVLGVNISSRSRDKEIQATGQPPQGGIIQALVSRIAPTGRKP